MLSILIGIPALLLSIVTRSLSDLALMIFRKRFGWLERLQIRALLLADLVGGGIDDAVADIIAKRKQYYLDSLGDFLLGRTSKFRFAAFSMLIIHFEGDSTAATYQKQFIDSLPDENEQKIYRGMQAAVANKTA